MEVEVDYSKQRLSVDPDYRTQVGTRQQQARTPGGTCGCGHALYPPHWHQGVELA